MTSDLVALEAYKIDEIIKGAVVASPCASHIAGGGVMEAESDTIQTRGLGFRVAALEKLLICNLLFHGCIGAEGGVSAAVADVIQGDEWGLSQKDVAELLFAYLKLIWISLQALQAKSHFIRIAIGGVLIAVLRAVVGGYGNQSHGQPTCSARQAGRGSGRGGGHDAPYGTPGERTV